MLIYWRVLYNDRDLASGDLESPGVLREESHITYFSIRGTLW